MEFTRGYVLPDFRRPQAEDLLSLLLIWDEIEVEAWSDSIAVLEDENDTYPKLKQDGLVREYEPFLKIETFVDPTLPEVASDTQLMQRAAEDGEMFADGLIRSVNRARREATVQGAAPLAATYLAELASALPALDRSAPVAEASMIQVAAKGIRVSQATSIEEVVQFREKNKQLMGRFRGAMADLAAAIDSDTPAEAIEQAHNKMVNRVEPELGNLTTALDRARINFVATEVAVGTTATFLASVDPVTLVPVGGRLIARTLKYAFDRDKVVREHPFGLIFRVHQRFGAPPTETQSVVTDPRALIRDHCTTQMLQFRRSLQDNVQV